MCVNFVCTSEKNWSIEMFYGSVYSLKTMETQADPVGAQNLVWLPNFNGLSVRIDVRLFTTFLRRWELVVGYAKGFYLLSSAFTVPLQIFLPRIPTVYQKQQHVDVCSELCQVASDDANFLSRSFQSKPPQSMHITPNKGT